MNTTRFSPVVRPVFRPVSRRLVRHALGATLALCGLLAVAGAQADEGRRRGDDSGRGGDVGRGGYPVRQEAPRGGPPPRAVPPSRWYDGAHGHNRDYPRPGWSVRVPPPRSSVVIWGGIDYRYDQGVWYTGGPRGYVVVRPPIGIVVADRPALYTLLTIGGLSYLYANGAYYREHAGGGYEVVPPPVDGETTSAPGKTYVYPRQGQSAEQQATDDYECHKWAVTQTGFDPTGAAVGATTATPPARRSDYERARGACLEGRGYTVR